MCFYADHSCFLSKHKSRNKTCFNILNCLFFFFFNINPSVADRQSVSRRFENTLSLVGYYKRKCLKTTNTRI